MVIKVLGSGCAKCQKLYSNVEEALQATGKEAEAIKVTDMAEIMAYKVMSMPALVIDEKVVSTGQILGSDTIAEMISK